MDKTHRIGFILRGVAFEFDAPIPKEDGNVPILPYNMVMFPDLIIDYSTNKILKNRYTLDSYKFIDAMYDLINAEYITYENALSKLKYGN